MARKSKASLEVVQVTVLDHRIQPPDNLTKRQKEIWIKIVSSRPHDWFTKDIEGLLTAYVESIASHERLSEKINEIESGKVLLELQEEKCIYEMRCKQASLMQNLATRMRLTNQSRYSPDVAHTKTSKVANSNKRPWE